MHQDGMIVPVEGIGRFHISMKVHPHWSNLNDIIIDVRVNEIQEARGRVAQILNAIKAYIKFVPVDHRTVVLK